MPNDCLPFLITQTVNYAMSAFIKSGQPNTMGRLLSTIAYPVQYPNVCTLQSAVIP